MAQSNFVLRQIDGKISRASVAARPLSPNQVRIRITHSGFCGTDHTYIPLGIALGHEGVGIVQEVGSLVTDLKVGDRVGGGYYRSSCGKCKYCETGREMWCYTRNMFGESDTDNGTLADYFVADETFLYKIPNGMSSEDAAPMQCAGATVYCALADKVNGGDRIGIMGIGGLGHLAIQFAMKLGVTVVVISHSRNKEAEAKGFGAHEFYLNDELENMPAPLDFLLLTGSGFPPFEKICKKEILARDAVIIPIAAGNDSLDLPWPSALFNRYRVEPSLVAGRKVHNDMLQFAVRHGIRPTIEVFPLNEQGLTTAVEKMEAGKLRYRAVLQHE